MLLFRISSYIAKEMLALEVTQSVGKQFAKQG